jgi:predicted kinase
VSAPDPVVKTPGRWHIAPVEAAPHAPDRAGFARRDPETSTRSGSIHAMDFRRPFPTTQAIEEFLEACLGIVGPVASGTDTYRRTATAAAIRDVEAAVTATSAYPTLTDKDNRDEDYRTDGLRLSLRNQILEELWTLDRLANDDDIRLTVGGARPRGRAAAAERQAYIVTGLPASGKSTMVNRIADELGAVVVDSDYAKRKFPEFAVKCGAQLVHQESAMITEGGDQAHAKQNANLLGLCKMSGINVVMPKIGHDPNSLIALADAFRDAQYAVHLTTVEVPREEATLRALHRFLQTERYVPLGLIFDNYANDPALTYYRFRVEALTGVSRWSSFGAVSNVRGNGYSVLDCSSPANPVSLFK